MTRQYDGAPSTAGANVPTLSIFFGIVISMYWRDHEPAHFHARYGDAEAIIRIDTLEVMAGSLPRRALALVLEWASAHRTELAEDWRLCRNHETPKPIPPLE
ncbi:DUF4160 domain-containing protein [Cupriavidus gilardii]|nr:DUF4160 domain-containing protein [Cupriavidus gilardii]MCT9015719.1 DUF4160 domain-containing protein [Cupriavidus gilardii]MCT9055533.1 DUF4160 domain-containing protein [Cupriavidus gilardii]MCT9118600.1 DUF4160 domain-containing protein [Cupriavidus gilardii]MCT9125809.1 DUF4160 domain-containing protein [Cupriavidus gilardii]UXC35015.1 DUF4160 domain-containing protein [Cupriavidus gilardii]